ncbi:sensor histidine kinase [Gracilimonas sp.]|uniref:sensor histidine kinase n=1 Tax=Gracilimonas sp. TaxID=1974203 RepID=UPI0028721268|nr:sensor histidine kinase [Gracilimonas sp.]
MKKENERKKRFTEKLIESQEQERRRIASELHDGLGQQILVIKNRAELAQQQADDPEETRKQLDEIMQSSVVSIRDVRNISHNLRPVHLEKFGLTEAIENLCDQLQRTSKIEWSYHIDDIDETFPENKEINFYRVIQEATNNIQKHSKAKEASVMIRKSETDVKATIWDDGKGFDMTNEKYDQGLGFSGMKERIGTLGGTITMASSHGQGTTIKIIIPK